MKLIYRIHLTTGDKDYTDKAEAFRQAKNIARAAQADVWVTEEEVPLDHHTL